MIRKIALLSLIFLVFSCKNTQKMKEKDNFKVEDQVVDEGNYQVIGDEKQAEALNENTQNLNEVAATSAAEAATVEVQDRVFFGYDSFAITDEAAKILDVQVSWLKDNSQIKITIEGHCDEKGTREYNIALGERRANAAKEYLVKNGVEDSRIKVISYGKERPAYFGNSEDANSKNRRAVVVVN